jgi:hypothetical protein
MYISNGDCKIVQYCAVMLYTTIDTVKGFGMWVGQGEISKFMAYWMLIEVFL